MDVNHPGRRLRAERRSRDLSQKQVAIMAGLTQPTISGIENGRLSWPGYVAKVAAALGLTDLA